MKNWNRFKKIRFPIILLTAVLTVVFGWSLRKLRVNPDIVDYFPVNDSAVIRFNRIAKEFGTTSDAVIAIESDDIFTLPILKKISEATESLRRQEGISSVISLTSMLDIRENENGIEIRRLVDPDELIESADSLAALKQYVLSRHLCRDRIVSNDAKATLIICKICESIDAQQVAEKIQKIITDINFNAKVCFGGFPFQISQISSIIFRDLKTLIPISVVVVLLVLLFSMKSACAVILPLLTVILSSIWTLGLMSLLNIPLTIISDTIPVILIAVGGAYSIHLISRFRDSTLPQTSSLQQALIALSEVALPVFLAAITTMIGFISFVFGSYLTLIREFGIFCCIGVGIALLISIGVVPAILSYMPISPKTNVKAEKNSPLMEKLATLVIQHYKVILIIGVVFSLLAISFIPRLQRKAAILDYFKPDAPIRAAEQMLKERFGGSLPINIVVEGDILDPDVLNSIKRMQQLLDSLPDVTNSQSYADLIEEMHFVMGEGRTIPDSRGKVTNLAFMLEGEEILSQMVNSDYSRAIVSARTGDLNTRRVGMLVKSIDEIISRLNNSKVNFIQTGLHLIYHNLDKSIVNTLVSSLIITVVLIYLCITMIFGSAVGGLIGLIPIVFTLVGVFGFMGWVGYPLDIVTVLIGSVSIGIGIDYTIHFANSFKVQYRKRIDKAAAIKTTIITTGRAITVNSLTVMCGFIVLVGANLIPLQQFGILVALTMCFSGFGAVTLFSATIMAIPEKLSAKIWKSKTTFLGGAL